MNALPCPARPPRADLPARAAWLRALAAAMLAGLGATSALATTPETAPAAPPEPAASATGDAVGAGPATLPGAAIRSGGPNKPYAYNGATYVPETEDLPFRQAGKASWYGRRFHGQRTASGEVYNVHGMTAAHVTLPIPSYARVRNVANGRSVIVRINDRGPFTRSRIVDLSYAAAMKLGISHAVSEVEIERITLASIRDGSWRTAEEAEAGLALPDTPAPSRPAVATAARTRAEEQRSSRHKGRDKNKAKRRAPQDGPPLEDAPRVASGLIVPARTDTEGTASAKPPSPPPAASAPLATLASERAGTSVGRGWWLQFATFQNATGAEAFYEEMGALLRGQLPLLAIFKERAMHKIQAGPFPSKEDAAAFAQTLRERLVSAPALVERK